MNKANGQKRLRNVSDMAPCRITIPSEAYALCRLLVKLTKRDGGDIIYQALMLYHIALKKQFAERKFSDGR